MSVSGGVMTEDRLLTVAEVAARLAMQQTTVREWLRMERLPGYLPGGRRGGWRVKESDLERFIESTKYSAADSDR
jgi:excisionase family DNA binding protein